MPEKLSIVLVEGKKGFLFTTALTTKDIDGASSYWQKLGYAVKVVELHMPRELYVKKYHQSGPSGVFKNHDFKDSFDTENQRYCAKKSKKIVDIMTNSRCVNNINSFFAVSKETASFGVIKHQFDKKKREEIKSALESKEYKP